MVFLPSFYSTDCDVAIFDIPKKAKFYFRNVWRIRRRPNLQSGLMWHTARGSPSIYPRDATPKPLPSFLLRIYLPESASPLPAFFSLPSPDPIQPPSTLHPHPPVGSQLDNFEKNTLFKTESVQKTKLFRKISSLNKSIICFFGHPASSRISRTRDVRTDAPPFFLLFFSPPSLPLRPWNEGGVEDRRKSRACRAEVAIFLPPSSPPFLPPPHPKKGHYRRRHHPPPSRKGKKEGG